LHTLPFFVIGVALNIVSPSFFSVGGPPQILKLASYVILIPGFTVWTWSVTLILLRVPNHQLITNGPYRIVKHPLYTGVAILVLPWFGFLFDTWLGAFIGVVEYIACRLYAREEEEMLSKTFGAPWIEYCRKVWIPWL